MRVVFLGSPAFACPSLLALIDAGHDVALVVSQPDRRRGRRGSAVPTAVRALAQERGVANTTLQRGQRKATYRRILDLDPDVVVVVAFGHLIREPLLRGAKWGCVNVHASLLPRWRGAAPVHRAILAGDDVTGVATMQLEEGMDTGPVYLMRELAIDAEETSEQLTERLSVLGGEVLVETLAGLEDGSLRPRPQPEEGVTHAPKLERSEGTVDFRESARRVHDRIRGLYPWPGVKVLHGERELKLLESSVIDPVRAEPGVVFSVEDDGLRVACGEGALLIRGLQPAGRRQLSATDYARGYGLQPGDVLRPFPFPIEST